MPSSDITRTSHDIRQGYKGVVMQQGRVILDRDFNALQDTISGAIKADALDIVGPCGTPDPNGFAISIPGISSPPDPALWVPPAPLDTPALNSFDFLISPGTMYVGGQRAVFPGPDLGQQPFTYSYFDQPDWIQPDDPFGGSPLVSPQIEFIYLHLFEQDVSAVEDPDLKDVALGGPDTTQRLRLMRRVERLAVQADNCASALDQATQTWLTTLGMQFDKETMQLLPQAALQVSFIQSTSSSDPCDPVATGGYLGADNQLIRVQISGAGDGTAGSGKLLWSYDNASFLYRVTVNPDGKTLQLNQSPVDAFHSPKSGQVVQVLRTAAVLESDPDASDPFHKQTIVRCIAEVSGEVRTLMTGYDPAASTVVLDQVLPGEYVGDNTPVFLRIWEAEVGFDPAGGTAELVDASGKTTGVLVTIAIPKNGIPPVGAYWMIAVRPSTPQAVYPESLLIAGQLPDGPRQWACPLAVIDWTAAANSPAGEPSVTNCRQGFDNLVELTKRNLEGCCTVRVTPADAQKPGGLQAIIDRAVMGAAAATVCFGPGVYSLRSPLRLGPRHSNLRLEGCQEGAILQATRDAAVHFLDGLVVLTHAEGVTLQSLTLNPPIVPFKAAKGKLTGLEPDVLTKFGGPSLDNVATSVGVRVLSCTGLTIRSCTFKYPQFAPRESSTLVNGFGVGILTSGGCLGLTVEANAFQGPDNAEVQTSVEPFQFLFGFAQTPVTEVTQLGTRKLPFSSTPDLLKVISESSKGNPVASKAATRKKAVAAKSAHLKAAAPVAAGGAGALKRPVAGPVEIGRIVVGGTLLPSWLQNASFHDNTFVNLTLAVVVFGETGSLRVQNNEVRNCYAGLWFLAKRVLTAASQIPAGRQELLDAVQDPLVVVGSAIARGYPLPASFSDPSQVAVRLQMSLPLAPGKLPRILGPYDILSGGFEMSFETQAAQATEPSTLQGFQFSLVCEGNRVDAQSLDSELQSSGIGLMVWGDENELAMSEVILTGNHITNNGKLAPVTTAMLVSLESCVVSSNLIFNLATPSQAESLLFSYSLVPENAPIPSLDVTLTGNVFFGAVLADSTNLRPNMAVAGNVFHGVLNIPADSNNRLMANLALTGNVFQNPPQVPGGDFPAQWQQTNWPLP